MALRVCSEMTYVMSSHSTDQSSPVVRPPLGRSHTCFCTGIYSSTWVTVREMRPSLTGARAQEEADQCQQLFRARDRLAIVVCQQFCDPRTLVPVLVPDRVLVLGGTRFLGCGFLLDVLCCPPLSASRPASSWLSPGLRSLPFYSRQSLISLASQLPTRESLIGLVGHHPGQPVTPGQSQCTSPSASHLPS